MSAMFGSLYLALHYHTFTWVTWHSSQRIRSGRTCIHMHTVCRRAVCVCVWSGWGFDRIIESSCVRGGMLHSGVKVSADSRQNCAAAATQWLNLWSVWLILSTQRGTGVRKNTSFPDTCSNNITLKLPRSWPALNARSQQVSQCSVLTKATHTHSHKYTVWWYLNGEQWGVTLLNFLAQELN